MYFTEFELNEQILEAIDHMGFKEATPIQEMAIPKIISGRPAPFPTLKAWHEPFWQIEKQGRYIGCG